MVTLTYQERFKTAKGVFDAFTERTLFELEKRKEFDELVSPLEIGKESNVFVASKGDDKVIVKIYRMQNADFKRMFEYIKQDSRYMYLKNNRRQIILSWTQREYKNLIKAYKAGVKVPEVFAWRNNIIVEEFIGDEEAAPPLKDAYPSDPKKFFEEIVEMVRKMYQGGLIHGDLSSFNILNDNDLPVIIDFSQATLVKTPNSEELLKRDVKNLLQFFKKLGVEAEPEEVLKRIQEN